MFSSTAVRAYLVVDFVDLHVSVHCFRLCGGTTSLLFSRLSCKLTRCRISLWFLCTMVCILRSCRLWDATIVWASPYSVDYACVCWPHKRHCSTLLLRLPAQKYLPTSCLLSARRATTSTNPREAQPLSTVPGYLQYP